uniref:COesterase domain-containing protein n=1 Tax=Strongyloides papillosus TaxID=174720 RepID=A0A0N5CH58_STREA
MYFKLTDTCSVGDIDLTTLPRAINSIGKKTMTITIRGPPPVEWTYYEENINRAFPGQFHLPDITKYIIEEDLKNAMMYGMLSWGVNPNYHPLTTTNMATFGQRCDRKAEVGPGTTNLMGELENGFVTKKVTLATPITSEDCVKNKFATAKFASSQPLIIENSISAGSINLRKADAEKIVQFFTDYMIEMKKLHSTAEILYSIN